MSDPKRQSTTTSRFPAFAFGTHGFFQRVFGDDGVTVGQLLRLAIFFVVVLFVTVGLVMVDWSPTQTSLEPGDVSGRTFKAPNDTTYLSEIRTEELRREAHDNVDNIVKTHDTTVRTTALSELESFIQVASDTRGSELSLEDKTARLQAALEGLTSDDAAQIINISDSAWQTVATESTRLVDETLSRQLQSDAVQPAINNLPSEASPLLTTVQRQITVAITAQYISPNVFIDDAATQTKRQAAEDAVEPVSVTVKEGQAIVRDGGVVSDRDIEALEALSLLESNRNLQFRFGLAGMMAVLTVALTAYLFLFNREIWRQRQLLLVAIVVLLPIIVARVFLPGDDVQFILPAAASAMLLAILVNIQFASIIAAIIALYIGVVANLAFDVSLMYFVASIVGAFVIWRAERTMTFIWAGFGVTLASFAVGVNMLLIDDKLTSSEVGRVFLETGLAGVLAASITFLSFSILGSMFGIVTSLQLQELAHPRQPLLNRLAREAPGTYHHSIIVSNLAESALSSVGGDPLFARVAVMYHDIGKMEHPTFFVENQTHLGNVHDGLDPHVSAQIIIDHVRDGVKLARKHRLPRPIIDVIAQHHGTTRVEFFLRKAQGIDADTDPSDFAYPGPKPQSREAAVIMMADSVEAAVRSMSQSGNLFNSDGIGDRQSESNRLADFVHSIVKSRINSGQFDDCSLTFGDIGVIESAFVQILEGIYHPRVEYPSNVDQDDRVATVAASPSPSD